MMIEVKQAGLIVLTTQETMLEMDRDQLDEIDKAIKAVRYIVDVLNIKKLTLKIN